MKVLAFGEILFDCYPTAKKIGGAPLNFCAHLAQLGAKAAMFSAVGEDSQGAEAISIVKNFGVDTRYLQICSSLPTGVCNVTYHDKEPQYDLIFPCAYDAIEENELILGEAFDVFYFGTLACRGEASRTTLQKLLKHGKFSAIFFDMNLRQHYYSKELVTQGLLACHIVKMNREEFSYVKEISQIADTDYETALKLLCEQYQIQTAMLTLDRDGACIYDRKEGFFHAPVAKGTFVSAVGAGDSFCACFLYHTFLGTPLQTALEKANLLAGYVVSREEAIPIYPEQFKEKIQ